MPSIEEMVFSAAGVTKCGISQERFGDLL